MLKWEREFDGNWKTSDGYGVLRITHSRKTKRWFLFRETFGNEPILIGTFSTRKEAQEKAEMKINPVNISQENRMARQIAKAQGWPIHDPVLMHRLLQNLRAGKEIHPMPRKKNPTKAQVKAAAKKIASVAGRTAWRGAKFTGRVGRSAASAAAREVKASICRTRGKNPASTYKEFPVQMGTSLKNLKTVWIARTQEDAIHVAKVYAKAYPNNVVRVP